MIENSLDFGQLIHGTLHGIADVYPLIPAVDATFPLITYRRTALEEVHDKDGTAAEELTVELTVAASDYARSLDIACKARLAMARLTGVRMERRDITRVRLIGAAEGVEPDGPDAVYLQILTFQITIE